MFTIVLVIFTIVYCYYSLLIKERYLAQARIDLEQAHPSAGHRILYEKLSVRSESSDI